MAADPNPALRAELVAAIAVIEPKVRGLEELLAIPVLSKELATELKAELEGDRGRLILLRGAVRRLDDVIAAMDELEATGYPEVKTVALPFPLFKELETTLSDLERAAAIFAEAAAASLAISLSATPKAAEPGAG